MMMMPVVSLFAAGFIHERTTGGERSNWIRENGHLRAGDHSSAYSGQHAAAARLQSRLQ